MEEGWRDGGMDGRRRGFGVRGGGARRGAEAGLSQRRPPAGPPRGAGLRAREAVAGSGPGRLGRPRPSARLPQERGLLALGRVGLGRPGRKVAGGAGQLGNGPWGSAMEKGNGV